VLRPRDEWLRELDAVLAGDGWIVDGNFEATLDRRLAACDTAIFLDFPPLLSAWRVFRRRVSRAHRPDLPDGVVERLNLQLLRLLLDYRRTVRRELARLLDEHASHVDVIVVRNRAQAAQLVDRIAAQCQPRANDSRLHT
jgi:adenylate kinase family enzyme